MEDHDKLARVNDEWEEISAESQFGLTHELVQVTKYLTRER
jgi:hypothetical protein